jgi:hypothetical protein
VAAVAAGLVVASVPAALTLSSAGGPKRGTAPPGIAVGCPGGSGLVVYCSLPGRLPRLGQPPSCPAVWPAGLAGRRPGPGDRARRHVHDAVRGRLGTQGAGYDNIPCPYDCYGSPDYGNVIRQVPGSRCALARSAPVQLYLQEDNCAGSRTCARCRRVRSPRRRLRSGGPARRRGPPAFPRAHRRPRLLGGDAAAPGRGARLQCCPARIIRPARAGNRPGPAPFRPAGAQRPAVWT